MTHKSIKSEQWYIRELAERVRNNEIIKPKY